MMSTLQGKKMVTRFKKSSPSQLHEQTMKAISNLLKKNNITVKKTLNIKKVLVPIEDKKIKDQLRNLHARIQNDKRGKEVTNNAIKKIISSPVTKVGNRKTKRNASVDVVEEMKEYYPDFKKRNLDTKRIELKPKPYYKVVGSVNKRKRRSPHRETPRPITEPTQSSEQLSVEQLVMTDDEGLSDDDWREILTCPSPVWWEGEETCDSPYESEDFEYQDMDEENYQKNFNPIKKTDEHHRKSNANVLNETRKETNAPKTIVQILDELNKNPVTENDNDMRKHDKNDGIVEKRSKLECLLDVIKHRNIDYKGDRSESECKNRTNSRNSLSDISLNGDEIIETLENIKIPVESVQNDDEEVYSDINEITPITVGSFQSDANESKNTLTQDDEHENDTRNGNNIELIQLVSDSDIGLNEDSAKLDSTVTPQDKIDLLCQESYSTVDNNDIDTIAVPSAHTIIDANFGSPKSIDNLKLNAKTVECDSISDTNIKYLDEYDDKCDTNNKTVDSNELVTVYKIVSNESDNDIENQIKTNMLSKIQPVLEMTLNSFFKKRKNSKANSGKSVKISEPVREATDVVLVGNNESRFKIREDTVTVRNTQAKYCYKCSSVFEGNICEYCAKNTTVQKPIKINRNKMRKNKAGTMYAVADSV